MAEAFLSIFVLFTVILAGWAIRTAQQFSSDEKRTAALKVGIISALPAAVVVGLFVLGTGIYIQEQDAIATKARDRHENRQHVLSILRSDLTRLRDVLSDRQKFHPQRDWLLGSFDSGMSDLNEFMKMQIPIIVDQPLSGNFWMSLSSSGQTSLIADDIELLLRASAAYDSVDMSAQCEKRLMDVIFSSQWPLFFNVPALAIPIWQAIARQCTTTYENAAPRVIKAIALIAADKPG